MILIPYLVTDLDFGDESHKYLYCRMETQHCIGLLRGITFLPLNS